MVAEEPREVVEICPVFADLEARRRCRLPHRSRGFGPSIPQ
jgi:hypothetical protein